MQTIRFAALLGLSVGMVGIGAVAVATAANDEPTTAPTTQTTTVAKPVTGRAGRLVQPYSLITDLSEDQKAQIIAIHQEITQKQHDLEAEEQQRCMAVLSDAQKTEMQEAIGQKKADAKKTKATAATQR